ncbi:MAG: toll/interleukin-1 receptor domain-containing protein [Verrucomicrobia subdivision 3 bacterium]|nr:toll/interleukin-1 receptor domain-containing protein [Limisphaerales bacterium]
MPEPVQSIPVFVSYTHDSPAHSKRVLNLSNALRQAGFDCDIDQYHVNQDWPAWMEREIENSIFVLVVCTPTYLRRWKNEEKPGVGLGAQWESLLTRQHLYSSPGKNDKFVPLVFETQDIASIPTPLGNVTRIDLSQSDGFNRLRCRLLNIPPAEKPPVRTSLAPISLAEGFFATQHSTTAHREHHPVGLRNEQETLFSNLFPVTFPAKIQTARVSLKRNVNLREHFSAVWKKAGGVGDAPVDFWIEKKVLYTFRPFTDKFWQAIIASKAIHPADPKPTLTLADSKLMADKNVFIKLLNRCLDQLCASHEMAHKLGWSKKMRCHLFVATPGTKRGRIKVRAITKQGQREVYKAIRNKLSSDPHAVQHWQHQAFRHFFVRFGGQWYLQVIPFWAFTSDGQETPSRWQKTSSANMRRPERNRAVLGHVAFWAAILCREDDLLRTNQLFQIHYPSKLSVSPSITDKDWIGITKAADKTALQADLKLDLLI